MNAASQTALAIDMGGTKILLALVCNGKVMDRRTLATPRAADGAAWSALIAEAAAPWRGRYVVAGAAVTGAVDNGEWYALNAETLPIPGRFPLAERLGALLAVPVICVNDAQAAAWGEYRHGAGRQTDMVFVTVSTGIGGGIVQDGRLVRGHSGLAGSIGLLPDFATGRPLEALAAGRWIARAAADRADDAKEVFAEADGGAAWAQNIVSQSLDRVAWLVTALRWILDPEVIVVGGGIGLVPGFFAELVRREGRPQHTGLRRSLLGADAGAIGVAELALAAHGQKEMHS